MKIRRTILLFRFDLPFLLLYHDIELSIGCSYDIECSIGCSRDIERSIGGFLWEIPWGFFGGFLRADAVSFLVSSTFLKGIYTF